jgi:hypothetical protein
MRVPPITTTPYVPFSNKTKLPPFASEYENITFPSHAKLEKDRTIMKLEVTLFSRTRDCYTLISFKNVQNMLH